jgi:hypothetical protein
MRNHKAQGIQLEGGKGLEQVSLKTCMNQPFSLLNCSSDF